MRLATKILFPNLLSLSLLGAALLYLLLQIQVDRRLVAQGSVAIEEANGLSSRVDQLHREAVVQLLSYRYDKEPRRMAELEASEREVVKAMEEFRTTVVTPRGQALFQRYFDSRAATAQMQADLIAAIGVGVEDDIARAYRRWAMKSSQAQARLSDLVTYKTMAFHRLIADVERRRARINTIVIGLAVFAFGAIAISSLYYGRTITRPIAALTETANRIAWGEVATRVHGGDRTDEIGQLARAFHDMAGQLLQANLDLEQKVEERTAELHLANEALRREMDERQRMQEALLESERLAAIGQMITGLSHESRNALQRSLACLEMLAKRLKGDARTVLLLEEARNAQSELQQVYEGVRYYASPLNLSLARTNMAEVWRDAWQQTLRARPGRRAQLVEDVDGTDLHCGVDFARLAQAFRNVMENSLAATADPVVLTVRCADAVVDGRPALRISLRDNGPGLGEGLEERLFEPFYTTKIKGTGLGIPVVKRIVEAHGGRIWVSSNSDEGLELSMVIPREEPEP